MGSVQSQFGQEPQFSCEHPSHADTTLAQCVVCKHFTVHVTFNTEQYRPPSSPRQPVGVVVDRWNRDVAIGDLYYGASAFLVLGGPSLKTMPLNLLNQRGILIMSVNNCPAALPSPLRPHVWLHTDPCKKFHDSLWKDPSVLKIVPTREWKCGKGGKNCLREKHGGQFVQLTGVCGRDMPGVLGFHRNTEFRPDEWLFEPTINRGNDEKHAVQQPNGWPKTINTMFAAVRMAFYLGIRRLYLLGADFRMSKRDPYAFDQGKGDPGIESNNAAYSKMNIMLDGLKPHFVEAGFEVVNCTPDSGLWTFPYLPLEDAVREATEGIEQELDCDGWYDPDK